MDNTLAKLIRASRGPVLLMTLGILLAIHQFSGIRFDQTFPILIIVFGTMWLLERMAPRSAATATVNMAPLMPQMAPLPPVEARDPLAYDPLRVAYDPLRDLHQRVYGDVPPPRPTAAPVRTAAPPIKDSAEDIPTAEHPIRQTSQPPYGETKR